MLQLVKQGGYSHPALLIGYNQDCHTNWKNIDRPKNSAVTRKTRKCGGTAIRWRCTRACSYICPTRIGFNNFLRAKGETTSVTDEVSGKTESYTYDDTYDRLTNYTRKAGETAEYAEAYTYDAYGQVSSVAQSGAATRT